MTSGAEATVPVETQDEDSNEAILRISITGHRPGDLVRNGVAIDLDTTIDDFLDRAVIRARQLGLGCIEVITGGALGVDQEVAAAIRRAPQRDGIELRNRIILPFPIEVMSKRWREADRTRLIELVESAGGTQIINDKFAYWAYHARNAAMVDAASMTVAFWNGKRSGGTFACIKYALKVGKPIWNALEDFRRLHAADLGETPTA